jgi:ABC-2 type transport system permease protein
MTAETLDPRRDLALMGWQIRYELRAFARNRVRASFTFAFPLMFLLLFGSLNKGTHISQDGGISYDQFFVPGILAYAVISTTFVNMAISTSILRDAGILKRMQGTPLPRWAYFGGRIASTAAIVVLMTAITLAVGDLAFDVTIRGATLPAVILALLLGTVVFTSLGIGLVRFMPNAEASPAVVNIAILPLTFISGIWFVTNGMPTWLQDIAKIFPIRALADSLQYAFNPHTPGAGLRGSDIITLVIWGVIGSWAMITFLRAPLGDHT